MMSEETALARNFAEFSDKQIAAYPQTARSHIVGLADLCESKSAQLEALKIGAKYPDSDCETHKDVITSGPVCIVCMGSELSELRERVKEIQDIVNQQAEDDGLWFEATTAPEAYLQQGLRRLHEVIEGKPCEECVEALLSTGRDEG